jgi:hypothetical protein
VHGSAAIVVLGLIENGLSLAVFGAVAIGVLASIGFLLTRDGSGGSAYDRIGAGGISRESDYERHSAAPVADSPMARAEREREIRQMLSARSERLVRSGRPALDVDAELARLLAEQPGARAHDAELLAEVRQLVLARNERRIRGGEQPLDVEAEVARTLEELDG